jgi:hypothetical protein
MHKVWDVHGPFDFIITGGAPGVDTDADSYAALMGWDRIIMPANWIGREKSAGHIRNYNMLRVTQPTMVLALPGGPGTAGMVSIAKKAHIDVIEVKDLSSIRRIKKHGR